MNKSITKYRLIFDQSNERISEIVRLTSDRLNHLLISHGGLSLETSEDDSNIDIYLDSWSPFVDERLVQEAVRLYKDQSVKVTFKGGISGSKPLYIIINGGKIEKRFYVQDQGIGGVNFNIKRNIRRKIFLSLLENFPEFQFASFKEITKLLSSEQIVDLVLKYGEKEVDIFGINECPNCSSTELIEIYHTEGNTKGGFLPNSVSFYKRCQECELVFLSKQVGTDDLGIYYTNDVYDRSGDTDSHKNRWDNLSEKTSSHYANYLHALEWIERNYMRDMQVFDLGCGKGDFAALTKIKHPNVSVMAIDWHLPLDLQNAFAEEGINYISGPIHAEELSTHNFSKINLVTMWEVVEHLKISDLRTLLNYLHSILDDKGALIFSTPDFEDKHCQSLDFWSMAPGEHLSVFSESVISKILSEHGFLVQQVKHESVTVKLPNAWYKYGEETSTNQADRASASIIEDFLQDPSSRKWYQEYCRKNNIGSEMIISAIKKT